VGGDPDAFSLANVVANLDWSPNYKASISNMGLSILPLSVNKICFRRSHIIWGFGASSHGSSLLLRSTAEDIELRVTEIETILAQQQNNIYSRNSIYDNKKIMLKQETIRQKQKIFY
jgi:hypothetical protein